MVPRRLDSANPQSYLRPIPFYRIPGGAFVRASVFRFEGSLVGPEMTGD
jgi:hypothetical protein